MIKSENTLRHPRCPICHKKAKKEITQFGVKYSCCNLWSWGDGSPLVGMKTHMARKAAHYYLDKIWKSKLLTRTQTYQELSKRLNIPFKNCHIKLMGVRGCQQVIKVAKQIINEYNSVTK